MPTHLLTERGVRAAVPRAARYEMFDSKLSGFGLRVSVGGAKTWFILYREGDGGRAAKLRRHNIGAYPAISVDEARDAAKSLLAGIRLGADPATARADRRAALTLNQVAAAFLADHVDIKRKRRTAAHYRDILERIVLPELGERKAKTLRPSDFAKVHQKWSHTKCQANRMLAVVGSMFSFAVRLELIPAGPNPAHSLERYPEQGRETYLTSEQLARLGEAIREAETVGLPWRIDASKAGAKHLGPEASERRTTISREAAAALRLLILTGARLREILNLRWSEVDFERGAMFIGDSKTGKKTIVLSALAVEVLTNLQRNCDYVIPGGARLVDGRLVYQPRADLKRPWDVVSRHAGLTNVRLHDLRHTFASIGAGGGLSLAVLGKLLGHGSAQTTERYAHLALNPLRLASDQIGTALGVAMGETSRPVRNPWSALTTARPNGGGARRQPGNRRA